MTTRIGVVGAGRLGETLAGILAAGGAVDQAIEAWSPVKEGTAPPAWVEAAAVPVVPSWQAMLPTVDALVVDLAPALHWHEREVLSEAAFDAGKALLVDAPLADFPEVYDRIQGARRRSSGRLWSVRPLARAMAVRTALDEVAAGGIGEVLAVHASLHLPVGGQGASFEQATNDVLDAALQLLGAPLDRMFAEGERSGGGRIEVLQAVGRTSGGAILSLEAGQVLPASLGEGRDLLFEVTGREGLVRVQPDRAAVTVAGAALRRIGWREDTIAEACLAWLHGADESPAEAVADRRLIAAMRMIKRARAKGEAVGPDAAPAGRA
jgi:predicted dehydrogenase